MERGVEERLCEGYDTTLVCWGIGLSDYCSSLLSLFGVKLRPWSLHANRLRQVMAAAPTEVVIAFHPLLKQITECLNFHDPVYQFLDASKNNACVVVKASPIAYVYVGGEVGKLVESCEIVARKGVRYLMKKYEVFVEDVTYAKTQMFG